MPYHERFNYSFNKQDGSDGITPVQIESEAYKHEVGDQIVSWAGAPGCGRRIEVVTHKDERGVRTREVSNTIRELTEWEVR